MLVTLLITSLVVAGQNALVGKWESAKRSNGGLGTTIEFNSDGTLTSIFGAITDATYSVVKTKLITTYVEPIARAKQVTKNAIRFEGDTLVVKNGNGRGQDIRMTRQTPRGSGDPIVGTWKYPHYSGAIAFVTFTRDGRKLLRIPLSIDGGMWAVTGDRLTMQIGGRGPVNYTYRVDGDTLTIVDNNKESNYKRASE